MAELDTAANGLLAGEEFAYVDAAGGRHLPIHDLAHVRHAIARWNHTDFDSLTAKERARRRILSAAHRVGVHIAQDDIIAKPVVR